MIASFDLCDERSDKDRISWVLANQPFVRIFVMFCVCQERNMSRQEDIKLCYLHFLF